MIEMPTVAGRSHIINRLKSVDGHLRGVIKMVEEDVYCMDVIKQLQAVQSAISRVNVLLLEDHLQSCVTTAIRSDEPHERERVIGELLALFEQGARMDRSAAEALDSAIREVSTSPSSNGNDSTGH